MSQYRVHSRTKKRLAKLEGKICPSCKETRLKALIIMPDGAISCYNCKADTTKRRYQVHENKPHKKTILRLQRIEYLGRKCHTCGYDKVQAIQLDKTKKELRCKNCLKAGLVFKYEDKNT